MITSPIEPLRCSAETIIPTSAESAAQPAIAPVCERATAIPSPNVESRPWKIASALAASADAEVDGHECRAVDADRGEKAADHALARP